MPEIENSEYDLNFSTIRNMKSALQSNLQNEEETINRGVSKDEEAYATQNAKTERHEKAPILGHIAFQKK